jgi:hypothetical protein
MKRILGVALMAMAIGVVGCEKKPATTAAPKPADKGTPAGVASDAGKGAAGVMDAVKEKAAETVDAAKSKVNEMRDKAVEVAKSQLDSANSTLDELKGKVAGQTDVLKKAAWGKLVDTIEGSFKGLETQFEAMKGDGWEKAKAAFETAFNDFMGSAVKAAEKMI